MVRGVLKEHGKYRQSSLGARLCCFFPISSGHREEIINHCNEATAICDSVLFPRCPFFGLDGGMDVSRAFRKRTGTLYSVFFRWDGHSS